MGIERPSFTASIAMAQRYQFGLNIALPADWAMQVYLSHTKDREYFNNRNDVIKASVVRGTGVDDPGDTGGRHDSAGCHVDQAVQHSVPEPCSAIRWAYRCNSDTTLNYLSGINETNEYFHVRESGIKADGPLFDLPGGR
jgi:hypothetical protein